MLKILIVGCGTIGSILAYSLFKFNKIFAYDIDRNLVRAIKEKGIKISDKNIRLKINITNNITKYKNLNFDLIIFTTKSYDVITAAEQVAINCSSSKILFLQNGIINMHGIMKIFTASCIYRGITTMAGRMIQDGETKIFRKGAIYFGSNNFNYKIDSIIAKLFREAGFLVVMLREPTAAIWSKLIFNAVMNPLPILTNCGYDIIQNNKEAYTLIKKAIKEGKDVAKKLGIRLYFDPLHIVDDIKDGKYNDFDHRGSMYYDFIRNKKLEIDYITGEIIREAKGLKIETPILETFYKLIKTLENRATENEKRHT